MKKMKKTFCIVLSVVLVVASVAAFMFIPRKGTQKDFEWDGKTISYEDIPTLEKTPGKDYKILMFSDTQLTFLTQGTKSVKEVMRKTLDKTQPDFVVFSGDNVAGITTHFQIDIFIGLVEELAEEYGFYWSTVFGNHDSDLGADLNYQVDKLLEAEHCLFVKTPKNVKGYSNFAINVVENDIPVYSLYFVDSNMDSFPYITEEGNEAVGYEAIDFTQLLYIKALADATAKQNSGEYTNALAISHYPLKQFVTAYNLAVSDTPYDEKGNKAFLVEGERREGEGCSYMDIGVFDLY